MNSDVVDKVVALATELGTTVSIAEANARHDNGWTTPAASGAQAGCVKETVRLSESALLPSGSVGSLPDCGPQGDNNIVPTLNPQYGLALMGPDLAPGPAIHPSTHYELREYYGWCARPGLPQACAPELAFSDKATGGCGEHLRPTLGPSRVGSGSAGVKGRAISSWRRRWLPRG